ncbi:MAG TPA: SAM-dependent chlorinase/fluorinase, partial [Thermoplasmata archaeon]|nr:SAM-dependent chlorinase/fluorinase [Thermoplasmata archaeon]
MPSRARRRAGVRRWVTLSSDLGSAYAAQMKAVLAHDLPPGTVIDLAHDLRPHALGEAAFVVRAMAARFPAGTVHIVVVDPGVGGRRAPIVVACRDGSVLVGPDNGVLGPLCDALGGGSAFRIDPTRLDAAPRVGTTFDGRDVFAPAAAQIATGTDPGALGPPIELRRLPEAGPKRTATGASGSVLHIDRFGNLVTDVPTSWVPRGTSSVGVRLGRVRRRVAFVTSY